MSNYIKRVVDGAVCCFLALVVYLLTGWELQLGIVLCTFLAYYALPFREVEFWGVSFGIILFILLAGYAFVLWYGSVLGII